jgi:hypothetical protein
MAMEVPMNDWNRLELNGGQVYGSETGLLRLELEPVMSGYADAQIDDYHGRPAKGQARKPYRWGPGTTLEVMARFSHGAGDLVGTAGFGFWNAPFGPGTGSLPALPRAVWFFYASEPGDLPLAPAGVPGRGWFAATIDATGPGALAWAPLAPFVLVANQFAALRRRLWPAVRRSLQISFAPVEVDMKEWHQYRLRWQEDGVFFQVDGRSLLNSPSHVRGPLGFVCWIDNQYLTLTPRGRIGWGVLPVRRRQWMELRELRFDHSELGDILT